MTRFGVCWAALANTVTITMASVSKRETMRQFYDEIQQVGRRDVCNTGQNLVGSHGDPRRMEASWQEKRWYRPKLPHCPLDTLCGKAPKVRRLCWWKIVGKGESRGHKTVQP